MRYTFRPMAEADAQAIVGWHYDGPYAFYDADQDPEDLAELLDPASWADRYYAVTDEQGALVGCFQFEREGDVTIVGLGLRPDLTGRGLGLDYLLAGLAFARARYAPRRFRLNVATFNRRAITVYERAGFRAVRLFTQRTNGGEYEFVEMERDA